MIRYAFVLSLALAIGGCGTTMTCSSEIVHKAYDLASDRYAVVEVRDCGATTEQATVVRVGRGRQTTDTATEVFVADSNHGATDLGRSGNIFMSVVWPRPGKLSIAYASHARVFRRLASAQGAAITFIPSDPIKLPSVP